MTIERRESMTPDEKASEPAPRANQVERADFARVEKAEIPPNQVTRD